MQEYLTSGMVAKQLRISVSTLKRWLEDYQLQISDLRNSNGWRLFSINDMEVLKEYKKHLKKNGKRFNDTTLLPVVVNETGD